MGGNRTYFFYSDEGLVAEFDASGAEIRSYGYEPDSTYSTNPLFQRINGIYYWYRNDHQGTPQKIVDTTGRVVWAATYNSFGNVQITTEDITNNLRFSGQYYDGETGLYYNLNRYYDPKTGRYLRTDPFGDGRNLYAYVYNNPTNLIDPLGYCAVNAVGRALGTGYGEESAIWYANRFNETGNPIFFVGGLFASLWTPDTWKATAGTLATAGVTGSGLKGIKTAAQALRAFKKANSLSIKAGIISGTIVGGMTFMADLAKTKSLKQAAKSALVSFITSAFATGTTISRGFVTGSLTGAAVNALLQKGIYGKANMMSAAYSGFATSVGGGMAAMNKVALKSGMTSGLFSGSISSPISLIGNTVLFSTNS